MPDYPSSELQLQWNLDRTVQHSLNLAVEFVTIATQDNIQPIALLACERFGTALPISRQTRSLVERKTRLPQEPLLIRFAKVVIKKAGGEALGRLCGNVAGLSFLALAAAITPVMASDEAGSVIQRMLYRSAGDKSLVPPEYHVEAIVAILEPQLNTHEFLDKYYEWDYWLKTHTQLYHGHENRYPSPNGIDQIVSAMRDVARVGDENSNTVVFTCYSFVTFVGWCLGVTPTLCTASGPVILAQPESRETILILPRGQPAEPLKVELFQSSGSLWDTFHVEISQDHEGKPRSFNGMVHVQAHAQQTLQILDADSGIKLRGILESLLYAIPHAISLLSPVKTEMASLEDMSVFQKFRRGNDLTH
ncbi:MAG: hypothetical protein Q9190_000366 [Brigantiaea leucoxantha]